MFQGDKLPCAEGQTSPNGLSPGCEGLYLMSCYMLLLIVISYALSTHDFKRKNLKTLIQLDLDTTDIHCLSSVINTASSKKTTEQLMKWKRPHEKTLQIQ